MKTIALEQQMVKLRRKYHVEGGDLRFLMPSLSQEIADTITGKHNQDVRMLIVGPQGSGKSNYALYQGYMVATEVAKRIGGSWQDYFGIDNVAIAKTEDVLSLFGNMKQYNIYLGDDIGLAWGARDFAKKMNKFLNIIFQLMRTKNCFLMLSIISNFLLDKVPRSLVNIYAEMNMSLFDYGMVFPKVFKVEHKPRKPQPFNIYPRYGNYKAVRYCGKRPPEELVTEYERRRDLVEKEIRAEKIGELMTDLKEGATSKPTKKDLLYPGIYKLIHEKHMLQKEACDLMGVATSKYREWEKEFATV